MTVVDKNLKNVVLAWEMLIVFIHANMYTSHNSAFFIEAALFPAASILECIYAKDDQSLSLQQKMLITRQENTFQMMLQFGTGSIGVVPC